MRPPVRSPQLRCVLFPSMYLPHLLVLPATFGLQCLLPPYPYFRAFYAVPVRQVRGLLTASFRFRLTADTLAVRLCASLLPTRTWDFHPLENAHAGQTKQASAGLFPGRAPVHTLPFYQFLHFFHTLLIAHPPDRSTPYRHFPMEYHTSYTKRGTGRPSTGDRVSPSCTAPIFL